jgi:hypothetical protein
MHGEVSRIGGTEAGQLPKYKNDIKKINIMIYSIKKILG